MTLSKTYIQGRKKEIDAYKMVKKLTSFCLELISLLANGNLEKEKELTQQLIEYMTKQEFQISEVEE